MLAGRCNCCQTSHTEAGMHIYKVTQWHAVLQLPPLQHKHADNLQFEPVFKNSIEEVGCPALPPLLLPRFPLPLLLSPLAPRAHTFSWMIARLSMMTLRTVPETLNMTCCTTHAVKHGWKSWWNVFYFPKERGALFFTPLCNPSLPEANELLHTTDKDNDK